MTITSGSRKFQTPSRVLAVLLIAGNALFPTLTLAQTSDAAGPPPPTDTTTTDTTTDAPSDTERCQTGDAQRRRLSQRTSSGK